MDLFYSTWSVSPLHDLRGTLGFGIRLRVGVGKKGGGGLTNCCFLKSAGTKPPWYIFTVPALGSLNGLTFYEGIPLQNVRAAHKRNNFPGESGFSSHTALRYQGES